MMPETESPEGHFDRPFYEAAKELGNNPEVAERIFREQAHALKRLSERLGKLETAAATAKHEVSSYEQETRRKTEANERRIDASDRKWRAFTRADGEAQYDAIADSGSFFRALNSDLSEMVKWYKEQLAGNSRTWGGIRQVILLVIGGILSALGGMVPHIFHNGSTK